MLVMPGGIDVHTHLDMPFGGTTSADDFETGTIAAAHGGTTTLIDFAIQDFGQGLYPALDGWRKRAEGKAVIDYAFHMIVRELSDQVSIDMDRMVRHDGRHVVQAVHGLSRRLHGRRRDDLQGDAEDARERRADLHARRERRRHRHAGQGGAAEGREGAEVSRADAADARRGRGHRRARSRLPRWPASPSTSSTSPARTRSRR